MTQRTLLATALVACLPTLAAAQTEVFFEDFESGLDDWTATGMWHLEAETDMCGSEIAPYPSGTPTAARYGTSSSWCHFNGNVQGNLTMVTPVTIPEWAGDVTLTWWGYEATECGGSNCGWDHRTVRVSTDGGATWDEVWYGAEEFVWLERSVDLSAYKGEDVLLDFWFDPIDALWNDFHGWTVDAIRIVADPPPVPTGYCTAKVASNGCVPQITSTGTLSLASSDFSVSAFDILNNKPSKLIWSRIPQAEPWGGGTLCIKPPAARTPINFSGGSPTGLDCSGGYSHDFTRAYLISKNVVAGQTLFIQFSGRDPGFGPPQNHSLSAGLAVHVLP